MKIEVWDSIKGSRYVHDLMSNLRYQKAFRADMAIKLSTTVDYHYKLPLPWRLIFSTTLILRSHFVVSSNHDSQPLLFTCIGRRITSHAQVQGSCSGIAVERRAGWEVCVWLAWDVDVDVWSRAMPPLCHFPGLNLVSGMTNNVLVYQYPSEIQSG